MNTSNTPTIEEIRRTNLLLLVEEHEGVQARVAKLTNTPTSHLSQIITRFTRPDGKVVIIGSKLARKIEQGCGKPEGWLDVLHIPGDPVVNELLDIFVGLSDKNRLEVLEQARAMSKRRRKA